MKIEPGKGIQHLPADANPEKTDLAVYKNGKKLAPHKVDEPYQRANAAGPSSGRKLSESSISLLSDEGYETDTSSISPDNEFSDTASITSEMTSKSPVDNAASLEEVYVHNYCKNAENFINESFFDEKSPVNEPLFWTDSMVQELKAIAIREGRPVTLEDYYPLNQAKNRSLEQGSHESNERCVEKLFSQTALLELPIYHPEDIKDRLVEISDHCFDPKPLQQEKLTLPKRILFSQSKEKKFFQYCLDQGKTSVSLHDYLEFDRQYKPDAMIDRQTTVRPIRKETLEKKLEKLSKNLQSTSAAKAFKKPAGNQKLEKGLLAGAVAGGVASGATVAAASAQQPPHDPGMFDHISPKDVPIDEIKIFAAHNTEAISGKGSLPLLATNQNMGLEDILDKTPIRGFDLDVHEHNGEIVLNHGGYFDATVSDDDIPKLDNVLETMNDWLDDPANHDEVLFLNFEMKASPWATWDSLEKAFSPGRIFSAHEYRAMSNNLGRAPTIEEIRDRGYKVVVYNHNHYLGAGTGKIGFRDSPLEAISEDRTLMEQLSSVDAQVGDLKTSEIAPHITTDQIDEIMNTPGGKWISLDQVSPDDPRFFKPEDRDNLALNPDLKVMGLFYESDKAFQSALLGFGTATASATAALALAGGAYRGFLNEKKIRNQDKLLPGHLKAMELTAVLLKRKNSKKQAGKPLGEKVTLEEVKNIYKQNQLKTMTKDTLMAGASSTVSLTGSALALGMLFPPLMPAFGGVSAGVAGIGTVATILSTVGNRKRLGKAIDGAFENPGVLKALQERVDAMNLEIEQCAKSSGDVDELLSSMVSDREKGERLLKASTVMLSTSLVARASGMSKYGMPALGTAAMGVGATMTGVLVALSAAMNFRDRHSKLQNLSQTTSEVLRPDYGRKQKRKLGLFGDTAFQRFLKKNRTEVIQDLGLKPDCKNKEISFAFSLPGNEKKLEYYLRAFAIKEWLKDLTAFANKQKNKQNFAEVRKDPEALKALLKLYAVKRIGDFAHNDTFAEGRSGTLKLSLIGAFSGIFFLPMLGVAAGVLGIGLGVSKAVAAHERKVFTKKLTDLMDNGPGEDEEKIAVHNSLNGMIDSWTNMLADTSTAQPLITKTPETSPDGG